MCTAGREFKISYKGLNEALGAMQSSNSVESPAPLPLSILDPSSNPLQLADCISVCPLRFPSLSQQDPNPEMLFAPATVAPLPEIKGNVFAGASGGTESDF